VREFASTEGLRGPLLQTVAPSTPNAVASQRRLLAYLREHETVVKRRFSQEQAGPNAGYWIHDEKVHHELLNYLRSKDLAWPSENVSGYGTRYWYAMHPTLGSAVMTTLGLAVAHDRKLDVVTPSDEAHETLLATDQNEVFEALLKGAHRRIERKVTPARLGELVIVTSGVNFAALSAKSIAALQSSDSFVGFQKLLKTTAWSVRAADDVDEYRAQLNATAEDIVDAWNDSKKEIQHERRGALVDAGLPVAGDFLTASMTGDGYVGLVVGATIAIGLLVHEHISSRRRSRNDAFHYLTQVHAAQSPTFLMRYPLGLAG
jgi:hypothetical protein